MVVPYGAHCPAIEIRHTREVGLVKWQSKANEPKVSLPEPVAKLEIPQSPAPQDLHYLPRPIHASLHVNEVVEVIESHHGIHNHVHQGQP